MIWLPPSLRTKQELDASEDLQFVQKKGWTLIKASSLLEHSLFGISMRIITCFGNSVLSASAAFGQNRI